MKGFVALVIFIIGIVGVFYYSMSTKGQKWEDLTGQDNKVFGVIANKYKGLEYSYVVDGSSYSRAIRTNPKGMIDGETYTVYYDSDDHSNSVIDLTKPIYNRGEHITDCISKIEKIGSGKKGLVKFSYVFEGEKYDRYHAVDFLEMSSYKEHQITINKLRPEIAYLTYKPCF